MPDIKQWITQYMWHLVGITGKRILMADLEFYGVHYLGGTAEPHLLQHYFVNDSKYQWYKKEMTQFSINNFAQSLWWPWISIFKKLKSLLTKH